MNRAAELWLAIACNPLRTDIDRNLAWVAYEKERWLEVARQLEWPLE